MPFACLRCSCDFIDILLYLSKTTYVFNEVEDDSVDSLAKSCIVAFFGHEIWHRVSFPSTN